MSSRENPPKWLNPCGYDNGSVNSDHVRMPDSQIVELIYNQVRIAYQHEEHFPEKFAQKIFNKDVNSLHSEFIQQDYFDWLPTKRNLSKNWKEEITPEHLQSLELDKTLLEVHGYLQKLAAGIEQMVWDEEDENGQFKDTYKHIQDNLNSVLCEIHLAIIEKNLTIEKHITRDVVPQYAKKPDNNTSLNIRNWIIYRDYLNMLEYIEQAFTHFKNKLVG